jgi:hypothetical protein
MSREETKTDLTLYLKDDKIAVIALKGLWGTGKTFLWDEVRNVYVAPSGRNHLYASLFGLPDLGSLKLRLFQNSFGASEDAVETVQRLSKQIGGTLMRLLDKAIPGGDKGTAALSSLGGVLQSMAIDAVLKHRLVVLDDVERRSKAFQIESVLGFIDDLKRNGCRVLVLLNDDPLAREQADEWRALKEKCIDRELTLSTTPAEAAEIGLSGVVPYRALVLDTIVRAGVTNIRVIQRIDRIVSTIFDGRLALAEIIATQFVSAVVILTALNFNAVPAGPSINTVLREWRAWVANAARSDTTDEPIGDAVSAMTTFKLTRDMEFIDLAYSHITTGRHLKREFAELFDKRETAARNNRSQRVAIEYIEASLLDPTKQDSDFIQLATPYSEEWATLPADQASMIALDLERRGAPELAQQLAAAWARRWLENPMSFSSILHPTQTFHPAIRQAIVEGNARLEHKPDVLKSIRQVMSGGWNPADQSAINDASSGDVAAMLRSLNGETFPMVVHFYSNEMKQPLTSQTGERIFERGAKAFVDAASGVIREGKDPRLVELLRRHFGERLVVKPSSAPPAASAYSAPI